MQTDILLSPPLHHSPPLPRNQSNTFVSASCRTCTQIEQFNHRFVILLADRSSSICNIHAKIFLNRTQSSHHCNDSLNKLSPSLASNNCCHSYCSRVLPSTQTVGPSILTSSSSSLIQQQNGGRRHQISGPASSNSSLIDDEQQQGNRKISNGDQTDCTTKLTCTVTNHEGIRRKKSASLNSPANSGMTEEIIVEIRQVLNVTGVFFVNRKSSNCR